MRKRLILPIIAAVTAIAGLVVMNSADAVVPAHIEDGNFYTVKNLSKGSSYAGVATADKCEELQYRVQIHNPGPDQVLQNVVVKASIPGSASTQNTSTATISASNATPSSVSDTATVNISSAQKVTYVPGSTQLLDSGGNVISSLNDVTSGAGASVGTVGISINQQRYVTFKAKIDCPPVPQKSFKCDALSVATVDMKKYKFTAHASVQNVTVQSYLFTVTRGSTQVDQKTVTTNALTADYDFDQTTPGTYTVTAVVNTDAGSTDPNTCKQQVTVPEDQKPEKNFKCEGLDATMIDKNNYRFDAKASVKNVTVKSYVFNVYKDSVMIDQKTVTTSDLTAKYDFSQSQPGTYIVDVVVNTDAGSTNPKDCAKQVTVPGDDTPPPPPVVPPEVPPFVPPTSEVPSVPGVSASSLPDTGPADNVAIVLAVVASSTVAYYVVARRFGQL